MRATRYLAVLISLSMNAVLVSAAELAFQLPRLDGTAFVALADFRGKPALLNFWSSDCPPCVAELPLLNAEATHHRDVQFIGIAVDQREPALRFLDGRSIAYPQLIASLQPEVLLRRFGNASGALPYTVVLDADHRLCEKRLGQVDAQWLARALQTCARQ